MSNKLIELKEKLIALLEEAIAHDKKLREQYNIQNKFRFVCDGLAALLAEVNESLKEIEHIAKKKSRELAEDERVVFVYLFNAQGVDNTTWQKMVNPSVFYEYSVNRPVYLEKNHVEAFIRSRANKQQHAYLTIVVKEQDILPALPGEEMKDVIGQVITKVREGSLKFNQVLTFNHAGQEYVLDESGRLKIKEE